MGATRAIVTHRWPCGATTYINTHTEATEFISKMAELLRPSQMSNPKLQDKIDVVSTQLTVEEHFGAPLRSIASDLRWLNQASNNAKHEYEQGKVQRAAANAGDGKGAKQLTLADAWTRCAAASPSATNLPDSKHATTNSCEMSCANRCELFALQDRVQVLEARWSLLLGQEMDEPDVQNGSVVYDCCSTEDDTIASPVEDFSADFDSHADGMSEYDRPEGKEVADSENEKNGLKDEEGKRGDEHKIEDAAEMLLTTFWAPARLRVLDNFSSEFNQRLAQKTLSEG